MPDLGYLLPFLLTALLLSITPGPGILYIAAQTIGRGQRAGWFSAIGTHMASYIHIVAAAFGISLILKAVPVAYVVIKVIGATYLLWLGLKFILTEKSDHSQGMAGRSHLHIKALKESFVVEHTNPKSSLFFIAFLPQFTVQNATYPFWLQIVFLGILANFIFTLTEICCVIFADRIALFFRRSQSADRWMRRLAGSILMGLGLNLLVSER